MCQYLLLSSTNTGHNQLLEKAAELMESCGSPFGLVLGDCNSTEG